MGRVEFSRPSPPLQASRLCPHGGGAAEVWDGEGAQGASAIGSEELPPVTSAAAGGGGACAEHVRH